MTRVKWSSGGWLDLERAFRFLEKGPSHRDLGLVADRLREAGMKVAYDEELQRIAEASGSSALVALDLATAVAFGVERLTAGPPSGRP